MEVVTVETIKHRIGEIIYTYDIELPRMKALCSKNDWWYTVLCWRTGSETLALRWKCKCESKRKQICAAFLFFPPQLWICACLIAWPTRGDVLLKTCQLSTWQRQLHIIFVIYFYFSQPDKQTINPQSSGFFYPWCRLEPFLFPWSKRVTYDLWPLFESYLLTLRNRFRLALCFDWTFGFRIGSYPWPPGPTLFLT